MLDLWRCAVVPLGRPAVLRERYVQDVDKPVPGSVTDVRWEVNTGTLCVPKSAVCVSVVPISSQSCQAVLLIVLPTGVERKAAEMSILDASYVCEYGRQHAVTPSNPTQSLSKVLHSNPGCILTVGRPA